MSFAKDLMRIVRRPSLALCVLKGLRDRRFIERSEWFDENWYRKESSGGFSGLSPAMHYSMTGFNPSVQPSSDFIPSEYLSLHPDAKGWNPLVHYERKGKSRGYEISYLQKRNGEPPRHVSLEEHQASFPEKVLRVREKAKRGERLRVVFLVSSASMFPARPLFAEMKADGTFEPKLAVIPDFKLGQKSARAGLERCRQDIAREFPAEDILPVEEDSHGDWPNILENADLAVYSSPYSDSNFRYNPHWSVGRDFLPIHVDYSYLISRYSGWIMQNHNMGYFWKAFFENESMLADYRRVSQIGGTNGECVGYMKMDALPGIVTPPHPKKTILIAPHHSVDGGLNQRFQVSNFIKYSEFFLRLPEMYPQLDFVFRPHPFLFQALALPTLWGPQKVKKYIYRIQSTPNMELSDEPNNLVDFSRVDAIVQDCGSFLPEWFYTGKPCCYMLTNHETAVRFFTEFGQKCLAHCYQAFSETDIDQFISKVVISGNDPMKDSREAFRPEVMINYPHAARAALEHIKASLNIP